MDFSKRDLGDWSIINQDVEATIGATKSGYYKITNKSYRDYQKDSHMGMDFNLYSTINEEDVLYKFRATKQEIS
ncbi:DUF6402 family protein [Capnocytophaga leadbetteri]